MMRYRLIGLVLAAGLVCACSKKADGPPEIIKVQAGAAKPAAGKPVVARKPANAEEALEAELMAAVFAEDYQPDTGNAVTDLENLENRKTVSSYRVSPSGAKIDPDGVAILIANAFDADDHREFVELEHEEGLLNVYLLKKKDNQWTVVTRYDNVLKHGSHGDIGGFKWVQLAPGKTGFALEDSFMIQGFLIENLALFDPRSAPPRDLSGYLHTHTNNDGQCTPEAGRCWDIQATWHMAPALKPAPYDDIVFDFSGTQTDFPPASDEEDEAPTTVAVASAKDAVASDKNDAASAKDGVAAQKNAGAAVGKDVAEPKGGTQKISGQARYAYDGKKYRLVSGEHLVPGV